jgi:hypothetical protein
MEICMMLFNIDLYKILSQTAMITIFVMVMMLLIEYLNVKSRGEWINKLKKRPVFQILLAAVLGIIPGCLGAYTIVSLYAHEVIRFSALVTAMIATSGDEAFVMFSVIPREALIINGILFFISIVVGLIIMQFGKKLDYICVPPGHLVIHDQEEDAQKHTRSSIVQNLKKITFVRALLIFGVLLFLLGMATGIFHHEHFDISSLNHDQYLEDSTNHDHHSVNWIFITYVIAMFVLLYIFLSASDHFLEDHLWEHIIKKHFLKIAGWTAAALFLIALLSQYYNLTEWMNSNLWWMLIVAVLVGILPESGPHIVFIILFFQGFIPLSILLASSITQDGHGALPLLAESRKSFIVMKAINVLVGFLVGAAGLALGL